jgi:hypothetical protein
MMRNVLKTSLLALALVAAPALAADAAKYTTTDTDIGTLLDTPETKAILDKHMPGFSGNESTPISPSCRPSKSGTHARCPSSVSK